MPDEGYDARRRRQIVGGGSVPATDPTVVQTSQIDPLIAPLIQYLSRALENEGMAWGLNLPQYMGPYSAGLSPVQQSAMGMFQNMLGQTPMVDPSFYANAISRAVSGDPAFTPGAGSVRPSQTPFRFLPPNMGGQAPGASFGNPYSTRGPTQFGNYQTGGVQQRQATYPGASSGGGAPPNTNPGGSFLPTDMLAFAQGSPSTGAAPAITGMSPAEAQAWNAANPNDPIVNFNNQLIPRSQWQQHVGASGDAPPGKSWWISPSGQSYALTPEEMMAAHSVFTLQQPGAQVPPDVMARLQELGLNVPAQNQLGHVPGYSQWTTDPTGQPTLTPIEGGIPYSGGGVTGGGIIGGGGAGAAPSNLPWDFMSAFGGGSGGPINADYAGPAGSFASQLAGWDFAGVADPTLQAALAGGLMAPTPQADNRLLPQLDRTLSRVLSGDFSSTNPALQFDPTTSANVTRQAADAYGTAVSAPRYDLSKTFDLATTRFKSGLDRELANVREQASRYGAGPADTARMERLGRVASEGLTGLELGLQDVARQSFEDAESRRLSAIPMGRDVTALSELPFLRNLSLSDMAINAAPTALAANNQPFQQMLDVISSVIEPGLQRQFGAIPLGMQRSELPFQRGMAVNESAADRRIRALPALSEAQQNPFNLISQLFGLGTAEQQTFDTEIARRMTEFGRTQGGLVNQIAQLLHGTPGQSVAYGPSQLSQWGQLGLGGLSLLNQIVRGGRGVPDPQIPNV